MAVGSRHRISQVLETVFGTTPANPAFKELRTTSVTLGLSKDALTSEELRQDRQIATFRQGAPQTSGDLGTEVSLDSHDDLLEAVLLGTWTPTKVDTASTISFTASTKTINDSAGGFSSYIAGETFTVTGSASNNQEFTVVSADANDIVVSEDVTDEAAGSSITLTSYEAELKAGTTRRSFSIQRYFSDIQAADKPYHLFNGCEYNTLSLTVAPNAIATIDYGIVGINMTVNQTETSGATYVAKTTTDVIDTFTGGVFEDGVRLCVATELTLSLDNGISRRFVIGEEDCPAPLSNSIENSNLTGQLTAYFENSTLLEKFVNSEASSLQFEMTDGTREYLIEIPRLFYTGGQPDVTGPGEITIPLSFQAVLDPTEATNIAITRRFTTTP